MVQLANKHFIVVAFLVCCTGALAQSSGALGVRATVQRSVLLSGTAPGGQEFSQGGVDSAEAVIALLPGSKRQTFSSRAVVANDSHSAGYEIVARVLHPAATSLTLDGVELSSSDAVISLQSPYDVIETHTLEAADGDSSAGIWIMLTVTPR